MALLKAVIFAILLERCLHFALYFFQQLGLECSYEIVIYFSMKNFIDE